MQAIMIGTPPETSTSTSNSSRVSNFIHSILSYDSNIMLAAIISLLLVILFVLLLHLYAKWFLVQSRQRSSRSVSVPQILGARLHNFHSSIFTIDTTYADSPIKGLDSSVISSLPLFVYKADDDQHKNGLECAICLSSFEDEEVGRRLPKCNHAFHVQCIDMWLHSHSTCPICRCDPVLADNKVVESNLSNDEVHNEEISDHTTLDHEVEIIVEVPSSENENIAGMKDSHVVLVGDSMKRIMSRNRSERKIHPSVSIYEPDV